MTRTEAEDQRWELRNWRPGATFDSSDLARSPMACQSRAFTSSAGANQELPIAGTFGNFR